METATLDEFEAINTQLAALVEAGVPLDMGLAQRERSAAKELKQINATVMRRVARGESLPEALEGDDRDVPAAYRGVMQLGIHTNDVSAALAGSNRMAESVEDSRFALGSAIVYPLIVCVLAYGGLIGFCLFLVPTLAEVYEELRQPPGSGFRILNALRETLPYWAPIPPLVLLAIVVTWWRSKSRRAARGVASNRLLNWIPGASQIQFQERCSRFAASLGALLENRVPFSEALLIAADTSGDASLTLGAKSLSAESEGKMPNDDSPVAKRFPPFLRWAIWHSEATTGRAQAMEIAARMYHEAAERRAKRLRLLAPIAVLVLLGGVVTLLYGLALFAPVTELLRSLAR